MKNRKFIFTAAITVLFITLGLSFAKKPYAKKYPKNNIVVNKKLIEKKNEFIEVKKELSLKDIFKEGTNYNDIIKEEIAKDIKSNSGIYFKDAIETVNNFSDGQPFYIEDGNIVIYYGLYEIAPYSS